MTLVEKLEHCLIRVNWLERLLMRMLKEYKRENAQTHSNKH